MTTTNLNLTAGSIDFDMNGLSAFMSIEGAICMDILFEGQLDDAWILNSNVTVTLANATHSYARLSDFIGQFDNRVRGGGLLYLNWLTDQGNNLILRAGGLRRQDVQRIVRENWVKDYLYPTSKRAMVIESDGGQMVNVGRYAEIAAVLSDIDGWYKIKEKEADRKVSLKNRPAFDAWLGSQRKRLFEQLYAPAYRRELRRVVFKLRGLVEGLGPIIDAKAVKARSLGAQGGGVGANALLGLIEAQAVRRSGATQPDVFSGSGQADSVDSQRDAAAVGERGMGRRENNADAPKLRNALLDSYGRKQDTAKRQRKDKVNARAQKAHQRTPELTRAGA